MPEHVDITDPELHEPKGVAAASEGRVYIADGAGSGAWTYLPSGWGFYQDNAAAQTVTTADTKITINGLGSATNETNLPWDIRGVGSLWDSTSNLITPIRNGDSYGFRFDFTIDSKSGSPTSAEFILDIGGGATPTNPIVRREIALSATPPASYSVGFDIFTGATFIANGGQIFLKTTSGSIDISSPAILLTRTHDGGY